MFNVKVVDRREAYKAWVESNEVKARTLAS